jgi:hypothetical protein
MAKNLLAFLPCIPIIPPLREPAVIAVGLQVRSLFEGVDRSPGGNPAT